MAIDATLRDAVRRRGRARLLQGIGYALLAAGVIAYMEANAAPRYLVVIPLVLLATSSFAALRGAILFFSPELELHRLSPGANYVNLVLMFGLAGAAVGVIALVIFTTPLGLGDGSTSELVTALVLLFGGFAAGSAVGVLAARRRIATLS